MSELIDPENRHMRICTLMDFYNSLLNDRQREMMILFYYEDLSLFEISQIKGISRQAVNSIVHRAVLKLEEFDQTLNLVEIFSRSGVLKDRLKKAIKLTSWPEVKQVLAEWQEIEDPGKKDRY
jgi:predicted DNA-binding protein YlxM (UPF0122 family)